MRRTLYWGLLLFLTVPTWATASDLLTVPIIGTRRMPLDAKGKAAIKAYIDSGRFAASASAGGEDGYPVEVVQRGRIGDSTPGQIADLVKRVRDGVCGTLRPGDEIKLSLEWDASAKVWGIGVEGKSGVEVTINCDQREKN